MAFNSGIGTITPIVMKQLVKLYNESPHKTLPKIMGFAVSPDIAESDVTIENALIKRLTNLNQEVKAKAGFKLNPGERVVVYNATDGMLRREEWRRIVEEAKAHPGL
jgi:hypothetical protein